VIVAKDSSVVEIDQKIALGDPGVDDASQSLEVADMANTASRSSEALAERAGPIGRREPSQPKEGQGDVLNGDHFVVTW
jgi:hypothetical protein